LPTKEINKYKINFVKVKMFVPPKVRLISVELYLEHQEELLESK
jgi:hypothetical protein